MRKLNPLQMKVFVDFSSDYRTSCRLVVSDLESPGTCASCHDKYKEKYCKHPTLIHPHVVLRSKKLQRFQLKRKPPYSNCFLQALPQRTDDKGST